MTQFRLLLGSASAARCGWLPLDSIKRLERPPSVMVMPNMSKSENISDVSTPIPSFGICSGTVFRSWCLLHAFPQFDLMVEQADLTSNQQFKIY